MSVSLYFYSKISSSCCYDVKSVPYPLLQHFYPSYVVFLGRAGRYFLGCLGCVWSWPCLDLGWLGCLCMCCCRRWCQFWLILIAIDSPWWLLLLSSFYIHCRSILLVISINHCQYWLSFYRLHRILLMTDFWVCSSSQVPSSYWYPVIATVD